MKEDEIIYSETIEFNDQDETLVIKIKPGEYALDFSFRELTCKGTKERELIRGWLKWDGCMNWRSDGTMMYHFCDISDGERLLKMFKKVYDVGGQYIDRWDAE